MKSKVMTLKEALEVVHDGSRIMMGGFLDVGTPLKCIEGLIEKQVKDLTLIAITPGRAGFGKALLYKNQMVKELISSHVGTTPESTEEYLADRLMVKQFFPMGTWVEKVHAGAVGLPAALIPVGVGILDEAGLFPHLEEPKAKLVINGIECFIEPALTAEVSIVKAWRADEMGNLEYRQTGINDQQEVAMAGQFTIAEVNEIVPVGTISPERVGTPGIFVNAVVKGYTLAEQDDIYRRDWLSKGKLKA
ncbi:MAG: 3-oxoacid CoA-transferase subunit A [Sporomusaceae bacterium]|nr:3-oxoacid CoA-transferase subunit A [Sporomusaceae bacterium]